MKKWEAKMRTLISGIVILLFVAGICFAQDLLDPGLRNLFHETLSGEVAKEHVIQITRYHRVQASRQYRMAAEYVLKQLRSYGFDENQAYIESFKSDGKILYQTWQSPSGWDIDSAELRVVEPFEERLVGYPEIAMSLITYSNPGDVTAELVWVGAGTRDQDYQGKDVKGKFVLATGYGGEVHRKAVLKYGAAAVVCYLDDERAREHPDMVGYTGMWPRTEELDRVTFGFNISRRQGERLRAMLESGKRVVLHGRVKGRGLEPFYMDVVVARIKGVTFPDEELVYSAHLDHPKEAANDNASGSAALLDMAGTLQRLISRGGLPPPGRTLRFLWVPEWNGTMAYVDGHPELKGPLSGGKFLANLNLDMVGENLEILHSRMSITRTPYSIPSILNDVVVNMVEMVDRMTIRTARGSRSAFNFRLTPYSGGSDHMMFIDRKIPAMMIGHSPDYTHHTSDDIPDRVDPVELERSEIIATAAFWYLANLTDDQGVELAYLSEACGLYRLGFVARQGIVQLQKCKKKDIPSVLAEVGNRLNYHLKWEDQAIESIENFNHSNQVRQAIQKSIAGLRQAHDLWLSGVLEVARKRGATFREIPELKRGVDHRIPTRLTRGPLDFSLPQSELQGDRARWYRSPDFPFNGAMRFELVNFIDGRRSVSDIRDALSAEFHPVKTRDVARYLEDLVAVRVVAWKK